VERLPFFTTSPALASKASNAFALAPLDNHPLLFSFLFLPDKNWV